MVVEKQISKVKRRRSAPTHRWSDKQTKALLSAIFEDIASDPNTFELPNCQKFYTKITAKRSELAGLEWRVLKSKIRNLRTTYNTAMTWKKENAPALLDAGDEKAVTDYINRVCPHFSILDHIYGKKNLIPDVSETLSSDAEEFSNKIVEFSSTKDTQEIVENSITNSLKLSKASNSVISNDISTAEVANKDSVMDESFEMDFHDDHEEEELEELTEQKATSANRRTKVKFVKSTSSQEKSPPKVNNFSLDTTNSVSAMVLMQNERLLKEEKMHQEKLEFEEKKWRETLKLEREKLEVKKQEIESNEKIALAKLDLEKDAKRNHFKIEEKKLQMENEEKKLRLEMEERLKKYEMKLKYERH